MPRPPFAVAVLVALLSCGGTPDDAGVAFDDDLSATGAPLNLDDAQLDDVLDDDALDEDCDGADDNDLDAVDADEDGVPRGVFASVAAFCSRQMTLAAPSLRAAEEHLRDRGDDDLELVPTCHEDRRALADAHVSAGGPFLELTAVTFVTDEAWTTHLLARTHLGWIVVEEPIRVGYHDDPGCPSILRDAGLVEARVIGDGTPALVVVTRAERLTFDDGGDEDDLEATSIETRAAACHLDPVRPVVACGTPSLIAESVRRMDGTTREVSREHYGVDAEGNLVVGE
jgi:hypothetical protein